MVDPVATGAEHCPHVPGNLESMVLDMALFGDHEIAVAAKDMPPNSARIVATTGAGGAHKIRGPLAGDRNGGLANKANGYRFFHGRI
jgi:hypothetical protein